MKKRILALALTTVMALSTLVGVLVAHKMTIEPVAEETAMVIDEEPSRAVLAANYTQEDFERVAKEAFDIINNIRKENGLSPFTWGGDWISNIRAEEITTVFSHYSESGQRDTGENCARTNSLNAQHVVDLWMNSPGHKAAILSNYGISHSALAVVEKNGRYFWVNNFFGPNLYKELSQEHEEELKKLEAEKKDQPSSVTAEVKQEEQKPSTAQEVKQEVKPEEQKPVTTPEVKPEAQKPVEEQKPQEQKAQVEPQEQKVEKEPVVVNPVSQSVPETVNKPEVNQPETNTAPVQSSTSNEPKIENNTTSPKDKPAPKKDYSAVKVNPYAAIRWNEELGCQVSVDIRDGSIIWRPSDSELEELHKERERWAQYPIEEVDLDGNGEIYFVRRNTDTGEMRGYGQKIDGVDYSELMKRW